MLWGKDLWKEENKWRLIEVRGRWVFIAKHSIIKIHTAATKTMERPPWTGFLTERHIHPWSFHCHSPIITYRCFNSVLDLNLIVKSCIYSIQLLHDAFYHRTTVQCTLMLLQLQDLQTVISISLNDHTNVGKRESTYLLKP